MTRRVLWLAGLSLVARVAHAQPNTLPNGASSVAPLLPARLGAPTRIAIERLADSLRAANVPATPLYDKAAEGALKGATDDRILAVVRVFAQYLGSARALLGPAASESDVVSAASALRAGIPRAALERLAAPRRASPSTEPLAFRFIVLADLASRGVPVDAAASAVESLVAHGAGSAELAAFRSGVERDISAGRDARNTVSTRAAGVLQRLGAQPPGALPVPNVPVPPMLDDR